MEDVAIPIKGADDQEKSILKWVRDYILRYQPVYIRRYNYSMVKQGKNESFTDFWTLKLAKAREAEIEDMDIAEDDLVIYLAGVEHKAKRLIFKSEQRKSFTIKKQC